MKLKLHFNDTKILNEVHSLERNARFTDLDQKGSFINKNSYSEIE